MIRLEEKDLRTAAHQSSKGNQLKWESEGVWYKADYTGYEGLARAGGTDDGPERLWFLSKPSVNNRCAVPE